MTTAGRETHQPIAVLESGSVNWWIQQNELGATGPIFHLEMYPHCVAKNGMAKRHVAKVHLSATLAVITVAILVTPATA